jgi:hypothetical protein
MENVVEDLSSAALPVAVWLYGDGALEIATAGKPDCYRDTYVIYRSHSAHNGCAQRTIGKLVVDLISDSATVELTS